RAPGAAARPVARNQAREPVDLHAPAPRRDGHERQSARPGGTARHAADLPRRAPRGRLQLGAAPLAVNGATSIAPSVAPLFEALGMAGHMAVTIAAVLLTLIIAYLSLVLGELVPKRLAIQRNAQFAYAVAPYSTGSRRSCGP